MDLKLIISQDSQVTENVLRIDRSLENLKSLLLALEPLSKKDDEMMRAPKLIIALLIAGIILTSQAFSPIVKNIPETGSAFPYQPVKAELSVIDPDAYDTAKKAAQTETNEQQSVKIKDFVSLIVNGESDNIRGIYSEQEFAYPVVQQPSGKPGFVSTVESVVTEFSMAKKYGVTGIVAHNYLAGGDFFNLEIGEVIQVIYGDGEVLSYKITSIQGYQALSPNSANSQFVDLMTSEEISATQLFKRVYMGNHHLTLQTCIQEGSEDSWGRLFVIAEPI